MSQLEINGKAERINSTLSTWGDLLSELEASRLKSDEVIVGVRFDGDDVLEFREGDALNRRLDSIVQLQVEVMPMQQMARNASAAAADYMRSLESATIDVSENFRKQLVEQANSKLSHVFDGIKLFVTLLRGIELSIGGPTNRADSAVEKTFEELKPVLESLIAAQTQQDWPLVADLLEYELLASLSSYEEILSDFHEKLEAEHAAPVKG
jgi:hypothetical protein